MTTFGDGPFSPALDFSDSSTNIQRNYLDFKLTCHLTSLSHLPSPLIRGNVVTSGQSA